MAPVYHLRKYLFKSGTNGERTSHLSARLRIRIRLLMLPQHTEIPIIGSRDLGPQERQPSACMDNLTYQSYLRVHRHGAQISDLEVATDATEGEEARFRDAQEDSGG
jgi:hypothetical protein